MARFGMFSRNKSLSDTSPSIDTKPEPVDTSGTVVTRRTPSKESIYSLPGTDAGLLNGIYSKIAADMSVYSFDYHKVDPELGWTYDDLADDIFLRQLTYMPNSNQTISEFIKELVFHLLKDGVVAIVQSEYGAGQLYDNLPRTMRVGKVIGTPTPGVRTLNNGTRVPTSYYTVSYTDDQTLQTKEGVKIDARNLTIIKSPKSGQENGTKYLIQALNSQIEQQAINISNGSQGGFVATLKSSSRSSNGVSKEVVDNIAKRAKAISDGIAEGSSTVVPLFNDEELTVNSSKLVPMNSESIENLTKLVYNFMGIGSHIIDGSASADEVAQYRSGTLEPIRSVIEDAFNQMLGYKAYADGERITFNVNALAMLTPDKVAQYSMNLVNSTVMSPDDVNEFGLGLPRVGGVSGQRFNRNNKASNAVTDSTGSGGPVAPTDNAEASTPDDTGGSDDE